MGIVDSCSGLELQKAFLYVLKHNGKKKIGNLIQFLLNSDAEDVDNALKSYLNSIEPVPYTGEDAIVLIEDAKLSKYQYNLLQK